MLNSKCQPLHANSFLPAMVSYHLPICVAVYFGTPGLSFDNVFFLCQPGVFSTPFPYWHQMGVPQDTSPQEMADACLYQLELLLAQQTAPRDTAAIILEPVL